jgi:DNA (cytosine-5)-methyltransferase 1
MTFGSLFSGIGGFDLGLERAGFRVIWQCECDPFARRVLARHWPGIPCYEDVRQIDGSVRRPDLLCGGFPCQDISNAGKRVGIDGERSGLWAEFARTIHLLRPRFVLVENVAAILVRGMGRVLGDLATLGYDAEWDWFPAAAFGADHWRDRTFLLAYPSGTRRERVLRGDAIPCIASPLPAREAITLGHARHLVQRIEQGLGEPAILGSPDGIPDQLDRLRVLGAAVVPQIAEWIGRRILARDYP